MEAYKIMESVPDTHFTTDRIVILYKDQYYNHKTILLATPTEPQEFYSWGMLDRLKAMPDVLRIVQLEDETWAHPHLYQPIKKEISK